MLRLLPVGAQRALKRWYYPRLLRRFGEDRWPEAVIVRRLVSPGDHVVDAGANVGYISMLLAGMVGREGVVHCFEPVPTTFDLLSNNLRVLGLGNVRARQAAVSDKAGRARMATPEYEGGGENLYESRLVDGGDAGSFDVDVVRLDEALGLDAGRVSFVKVDVEGHELAAIRGAGRLLDSRPAFLVEVSGDPDAAGSSACELFELMASRGYGVFWLRNGRLVRRSAGDRCVDYFFLTDGQVNSKLAGVVEE